MLVADTYAASIDGLKLAIRQQIAPHITTLARAQTMAIKVDLYSTHEGKGFGSGSNGEKGGCSGGCGFAGQKGELGVVEEGPQPDSVTTVAEKKQLKELKKKSWVEAKKLRSQSM